ncbi:MAG TPA: hypothetical protein PLC89_04875 [Haliscomenobacter sp.]|uniref:hypothetical protein n=1 Tax=Haliscomenobacter sp. TaxID=2717303 RepID=UPI002B65ADB2|nr:hypothetical protein [Haliscomenobacter sp.]HOY16600.1 hypothetical protein [Haliscomenobacter sp.]HPH20302.1 hypothetical protein [Haliscomenobacter sp.]
MKQMILLAAIVLTFKVAGIAQTDSITNPNREFKHGYFLRTSSFFFSTNLSAIWLKNMQQFLKERDLAKDTRYVINIPFETGFRFNDWFFSLNMAITTPFFGDDAFNPKMFTTTMHTERTVFKTRNYRFNVGLGASLYQYAISIQQEEPDRQVNFNDLLNTTFRRTPVLSNRGGAFDVAVSLTNREKRPISIENCFRLGYRRGFKRYKWKSESFQLINAPSDQLDMIYFQYLVSISRNR